MTSNGAKQANGAEPGQASPWAAGQQPADAAWPVSKPLAFTLDSFVPTRFGHPPPGSVPEEIVPEGNKKPLLFEKIRLPFSGLTLKNRIIVSPMCQYSSRDGLLTPYHLAHHGSWALHGVGTIVIEASGVSPEGRITPQDSGLWNEAQRDTHASLVGSLKSFTQDLTVGVQLAHAGRKASDWSPFYRGEKKKQYVTEEEGGWPKDVVGPSPLPYGPDWIVPRELSVDEIKAIVESFKKSADLAFSAGYDFVEVHAAHGYLVHSFISPFSNRRTDGYGGSLENRTRILLEIVRAIKSAHPNRSIWVRISASDFLEETPEHGLEVKESAKVAEMLQKEGVDLYDISAGGLSHLQKIKPGPGYQLGFAAEIRQKLTDVVKDDKDRMLVGAVGMMEGPEPDTPGKLAEEALKEGKADVSLFARGMMGNPKWAEDAGVYLFGTRPAGNPQYHRTHPAKRTQMA